MSEGRAEQRTSGAAATAASSERPWRSGSGEQIWQWVKSEWPPPFRTLFEPGATPADLDAAERRLGAALPPRARELAAACTGAGLPAAGASAFHAETCLAPPASWARPGQLLGEAFEWDEPLLADHVVIGWNPEGADYSNPVLLRLSTCEAFGAVLNIPELRPLGPLDRWVAEDRPPGCGDPAGLYLSDGPTPEEVAESHAFYLQWGPDGADAAPRAAAWAGGQRARFVAALAGAAAGAEAAQAEPAAAAAVAVAGVEASDPVLARQPRTAAAAGQQAAGAPHNSEALPASRARPADGAGGGRVPDGDRQ